MNIVNILKKILEKLNQNSHLRLVIALWPFLWSKDREIRLRFVWAFLIILVSTALSVSVPLVFKVAVDGLNFTDIQKESLLFFVIISYGLIWTVSRVAMNLRELIMFGVMEKGVTRLSSHIFEHLHSLSFDFHLKRKTGEITSAIEKAQNAFPGILWPMFFLIIPTLLEVLVVLLLLTYFYGVLYGLIMIATVVMFIIYSSKALSWSLESLRKSNETHYLSNSKIVDSLINFSTIKYFNTQILERDKCREALQEREQSMVQTLVRGRCVSVGQDVIIGSALILFSIMSAYSVLYQGYGVSDFVLINAYVLQFSIPLGSLGFILSNFREQLTHMEKTIELLNHDCGIKGGQAPLQIIDQKITISCKDLQFGYEARKPLLKGISFEISPGETLAIVGLTGSGKSTITHLLMRFYELQLGEILINGQDIRTLKQKSFLKFFGVVPQDITLFNDSLKNNLMYGNPLVSDEELNEVVNAVLLTPLIDSLPEGMSTIVGERGLALSTGEKQKVGIARVLLKKPSFYIFDEATSSLDVQTEKSIMRNIREKTQYATVLVIAHRLSTVRDANKILVFDKGKIIETGTHSSLLKQKGYYAKLISRK